MEKVVTKSKIEWTDRVWNPVTGCTKVSEGCRNCYAERLAKRWWGARRFSDVRVNVSKIIAPLRWTKPSIVFVNSMSDLYHEKISFRTIDEMYAMMIVAKIHDFLILTKRPHRLQQYIHYALHTDSWRRAAKGLEIDFPTVMCATPTNIWTGISAENQRTYDERTPPLMAPSISWSRFLSAEPLLGPIRIPEYDLEPFTVGYKWVIVGGESGPGHRPMDLDWARDIRDQCRKMDIPFFFIVSYNST